MSSYQSKVIPISGNNSSVTQTGEILSSVNDYFEIDISNKLVKAKKAFSCIIEPLPEDIVMCCKNENGLFYILGIIERKKPERMNISLPEHTNIESRKGSMNIFTKESITMASESLNCFSKRTVHKSKNAVVAIDNITATGDDIQASFKSIRVISKLINTIAKSVIEKFRSYIRDTEGFDKVKAGQLTRQTEGLYSVDSKHTIMNSKEYTKIDGEKILMG
ncbi:MAG: DUF3540 domain-containing protein [Desulfobacterales bacterium]|nr:DUF3540 domain-containing protein [Desulfobacterales bacterium]MCP4158679.1 DUF3540 domain-containing protein [Deltaproteobacteria bacterium]